MIDCGWTTTDNNATIAQVSQEFTDHMTMHTLNAAIMAIAREGVERAQQLLPERSCTQCGGQAAECPELWQRDGV